MIDGDVRQITRTNLVAALIAARASPKRFVARLRRVQ